MTCCYDSGDMPAIFNTKYVVARKSHTCCECGRIVKSGDLYETTNGLWDGCWSNYKTCEKCSDIRESVAATVCVIFGELYESYEYIVGKTVADRVFGIITT